jgi:hypothetical protein
MSDTHEPAGSLVTTLLQEIIRSDAKHQHGLLGIAVVEGIAAIHDKRYGVGFGMATFGLARTETSLDRLADWLWETFPEDTPLGAKLVRDDYPFNYDRPWYFWIALHNPPDGSGFWLARHELHEWLASDQIHREINEQLIAELLDVWRQRFLAKVVRVWHELAEKD